MRDNDLVVMGYVSGAFGVRGWIKVQASTEYADSLLDYPTWWMGKDGSWKSYTLEEGTLQPKALAAKLEDVDDRGQAEALRGYSIAVPRSEFPEPDEDEFYWTDLVGLEVFNKDGALLGKVQELMETGANDVLVVHDGTRQRMIPFVAAIVLEVDLEAKRIVADWELDY